MHRRMLVPLLLFLILMAGLAPAALAQGPVTAADPGAESKPPAGGPAPAPEAGIQAVATRYTFSSSSGTYSEITGGTQLTTVCDDENYNNYAIGFTFTYDGVAYTVFSVQCNGFIAMGPTVSSSYTPISGGTTNNVISALGMDLQTNATDSEIRYEVLGTSPNQVLVVQYKNFRNYNATGDSYNFQIRLYETSNLVEIVYGPFVKNTTDRTPQVGLRGASNADFNNRKTSLPTYGWANSLPGTTNADTMALTQASLPPNGLTYDWTIYPVRLGTSRKVASANRIVIGDLLTYTVYITNTGDQAGNGTVMTDTLPAGTTYDNYVWCSAGTCSYDSGNNRILWNGDLAVGAGVQVRFRVDTDNAPCGSLVNTARIKHPDSGPVTEKSVTTQLVAALPYFEESFDGVTFPPTGWSTGIITDTGTDPAWTRVTAGTNPTIGPHSGAAMAQFNSYSASRWGTAHLTTPVLDLSALTQPMLSFWMVHLSTPYSSYGEQIQVFVSTDGGSTWAKRGLPIKEIDFSYTAAGWGLHWIDLRNLAGQSNVQIRFLGYGDLGNNMFIDDVTVAEAWYPCQRVELEPNRAWNACRGTTTPYFYPLVAWNATNAADTINLTQAGGSWPSSLTPTTLNLGPAAYGNTTPSVYVPWTATEGSSDTFVATATGSGGRSDTATVKTTAAGRALYNDYADVPFARRTRDHSVVYLDGKLYKFGGWDYTNARNYVDIYNIATDTWTAGAPMPTARYWIDGGAIGNRIYLAGGYDTAARNSLQIYDTINNTWILTGTAMPGNRYEYAAVVLNNKYYVIGGYDGSTYYATMWAYDPTSNSWDTTLPSMTVPRRWHSAGVINGKIYVAGGWTTGGVGTRVVEVYDPVLNSWSTVAQFPATRPDGTVITGWIRAADGVLADRYLVMLGGANVDSTATVFAAIYDAVADTWSWLPYMPHLLYSAAADGDGVNEVWLVSGRISENTYFNYGRYTTRVTLCATCEAPSGLNIAYAPPTPGPGQTVYFTGTVAAGQAPIAYTWAFGDGDYGSGQYVNHAYANVGLYTVVMTATNCDGLYTPRITRTVVVADAPVIVVDPDSLEATQCPDTVTTQTLSICNVGLGTLYYTITEVPGTLLSEAVQVSIPAGPMTAPAGTAVAGGYAPRPAGTYTRQPHARIAAPPNVLLLNADDDNDYGSPIQAMLQAYGDLGAVDLYDPRSQTPSLADLLPYDVVVVWSNYTFADATAIGNVLADYVDAGGKVIDMMFALDPSWGYQGRFRTQGYTAFTTTSYTFGNLCLGTYDPTHPVMSVPTPITNVCEFYRATGTALTAGSTAVARWADNEIFVGVKDNRTVVTINGYVGYYYQWTGQMDAVLHNAILWLAAGPGPDIPWLSENPITGAVGAGSCDTVVVTFDSTGLTPGTYTGTLEIASNATNNPTVPVPVTLNVAGPPTGVDFDWTPPAPEANVTVTFNGSATSLVPVDYTWAFGDGAYGSGQNPTHAYALPGYYTVVMTATSCGTYVVTATHDIGVVLCQSVQEDFEGTFPPAGWTVVNNGGNCVWQRNDQVPNGRPNYAGGQGYCADADSDRCGSGTTMNTELRSPVIDLSSAAAASLSYMASYNWLGGAEFANTDISTDGGNTWTTLLHWVEDHSPNGPGELVTLDLTPYVGNAAVMVRFHYYAPGWDWWWEVDQVRMNGCYVPGPDPDIAVSPTAISADLLMGETATATLTISNWGMSALDWSADVGCGTPVPWLSLDPASGSVSPITSVEATATFDAAALIPGTYTATICINSNDPDEPQVQVAATLEVTGTPAIAVNPEALQAEQCPDTVTTQTLSICNVGYATLHWSLRELTQTVQLAGWQPLQQPTVYLPELVAERLGAAPTGPAPAGAAAAWAYPEDVLWDNGPLVTHPGGGYNGHDASALQTALGMSVYGFGNQFSSGYRMADDFTISDPAGWNIDTITFFAYQTASYPYPPPSTITGIYLQIWDGPPWAGGSVIWGDLTTNRLLSTGWPGIYRVLDTDLLNAQRPVMANVAQAGLWLPPGTYWLDWTTDGSGSSGPWAPPITILGQTTTGDAYQYTTAWAPALDSGTSTQQGMPFIIEGTVALDVPWLAEDPISGAVPVGECQDVTITFDSTGLAAGDYFAGLLIESDDPDTPTLTVPVALTVLAPVSADFTWSPLDPPVNAPVYFTATASGAEPIAYEWAFGDGEVGSGQYVSHTYAEPGTYEVVLIATNACGPAVVTHTLTVVGAPDIVVTPEALAAAQCPDTVTAQELLICNEGNALLTWSLEEITWPLVNAAPRLLLLPAQPATTSPAAKAQAPAQWSRWLQLPGGSYPQATHQVLLVSPDSSMGDISLLLSTLAAYPDLVVTVWDNTAGNPTAADMAAYDVVFIGNDYTWESAGLDKALIGDALADYIDAGGKVIESEFVQSYDQWGFAGRYMTDGYSPFTPALNDFPGIPDTMDILEPTHPVMQGIGSIGDARYQQDPGLAAGATLLADWDVTGNHAVAVNDNVVALNLLIFHSAGWTGDVGLLLHNAIVWLNPAFDIPWLSEDPTSGTVEPGACQTVTVTFDATGLAGGTYTGALEISSDDPDTPLLTVPVTLTVQESPSGADFTWFPPNPFVGEQVAFTGTVAGGTAPFTWAWAFGDGTYGSGPNPTHAYAAAGTYTVRMTVTNDCGEDYATYDITVVEGCVPPTGADFTWSPNSPIMGEVVHFTGTVAGGTPPITYTWDFGDGGTGSGANPTHTYTAAGTYTVRMTATNGCGEDYATYDIVVVEGCVPPTGADFTWLPPNPAAGQVVAFTGSTVGGTPPITFAWSFGDGGTDVGNPINHTYALSGTYTVVMTATNACGAASATHDVVVSAVGPTYYYLYLPIIFKNY